ncbi:MAG: site-specific DNA-methyltransferase, partial [Ardenticatenia bacterium]|nr:site-specific DNA-methyltransferase [Ardenticatenia bacterium]
MGTGTTNVAASRWGRHSIGFDISADWSRMLNSFHRVGTSPPER